MSTWNDGLYMYDFENVQHFTKENSPLPGNELSGMLFKDGKLWLGVTDNFTGIGIVTYEGGTWQHLTENNSFLEESSISFFYELSNGDIMAFGTRGFHVIGNNGENSYTDLWSDVLSFNARPSDAYEQPNGKVLITTSIGVAEHDPITGMTISLEEELGDKDFEQVLVEPNGAFWLAENFMGLYYYQDFENFTYFDAFDYDLPSDYTSMFYQNDTIIALGESYNAPVSIVYKESSSVSNKVLDIDIDIFPNPCVDRLFLSSSSNDLHYQVFNSEGKLFTQGQGDEINLQEALSGMYIVQVRHENETSFIQKKIVKQ